MHTLAANGANIPVLGLGTWQLRDESCRDIVSEAVAVGYRHVDTAIMYRNEEAVGAGLSAGLTRAGIKRDDVFVTTKIWPDDVGDGALQSALEGSLSRLSLDHVDLVLVHWPSKTVPFEETFGALDDVVARGMARHVGVSNFTTGQVEDAVRLSSNPIACNQIEHHPYLDQTPVREVCESHGIAVMAYCPLFRGGPLFEEDAVTSAAARTGKSPAQVVLRWHVQQPNCGAIPKTATLGRLSENLDVFDFELTAEEMAAITALGVRQERICDFEFSPRWDPPRVAA